MSFLGVLLNKNPLSTDWCVIHPLPLPPLSSLPPSAVGCVLDLLRSGVREHCRVTTHYCRIPRPCVLLGLVSIPDVSLFGIASYCLPILPYPYPTLSPPPIPPFPALFLFLELEEKRILAWKIMRAAWQCIQEMWVTLLCGMFWGALFMRYVWTSGEGDEIPQRPRCLNWRNELGIKGEMQFGFPQHTPPAIT